MEKELKAAKRKIKAHLKAQEFKDVLPICEELISRDVRIAEIFLYQGVSYARLQKPSAAIKSYEQALEIDENSLDALKGLCQSLLNADEEIAPPLKKLSSLNKLLKLDPAFKNAEAYRREICLCHWKVAEYDLSFRTLLGLSPDKAKDVQRIMFTEVSKTNSGLCFEKLYDIQANDEEILPIDNRMKFYFEYSSFLNDRGEDPSNLINMMLSKLDFYRQRVRVDSSGSSVGSEEAGVLITPNLDVWWPSQSLSAQLWTLWDQIGHWNGSPKLDIPESMLDSLEDTATILRKDKCTAKTVLHLLQDLDCDKCQEVVELCSELVNSAICSQHNVSCNFSGKICTAHCNPTMLFLREVARATVRKDVEKIPGKLTILEQVLRDKPTFHNASLLRLVLRFRCYVRYTFNIPSEMVYVKECAPQDPVVEAWLALIDNSTSFLTCEHPHPMVDAVKQYILGTTNRHVHVEKLLSIRESQPKNFTYSILLLKVLKKEVEAGGYDKSEFESLVNKCYCSDKKNPTILSYLGDICRTEYKDNIGAAKYFEKSVRFGGGTEVLKLLDSLPQTDDSIRDLNIKSHNLLLKTSRDHKLHIRLAMLYVNDSKQAIKHLQQALKISPEALTLELLAEKYLSLGKYRSAYMAYDKANEMEATSYRQYSLAAILLHLGRPAEALAQLEEIVESNSTYGPALLGCVKALYQLTVNCVLHTARYPHAVLLANKCVQYLDKVLSFEPRWSAVWKYLGDLCLQLVVIRDSSLSITSNIRSSLEVEEVEISGKELVHLALKSYNRGLELTPGCSEYLLDLTRSYLELARYQEEYLLHALTLAKRAVSLRPRDHLAWNLLGAVCIRRRVYNLAQHAHIKSLTLDNDKNPAAWTNLGLLYMLNQEYQLANQCFSEAQSHDPKYAQCWVAMAYLAQQMGYEGEAGKIFKDLVQDRERRTTVEGTLEYAVRFCQGDMSEEMIHEVLTLTSRCAYLQHSADWLLFNLSGVLSEQLALHSQALQHYVKATTLSPTTEVRAELQRNVERVQCKLGNYSAMNPNSPSLWLSLAHMKRDHYGMASSILDNITGGDLTPDSQIDVSVFQAVLCWISQDKKSISTYLQETSSETAQMLRCLMLSEEPPQPLRDTINSNKSPDLQAKFACLSLKLHDALLSQSGSTPATDDLSELFSKVNAIPVASADSQYLFAKYLVTHKLELRRARRILDNLLKSGALREDIYELYVEIIKYGVIDEGADEKSDEKNDEDSGKKTDDSVVDNENDNEITNFDKTDSAIRKYVLKSYRMFPWRENTKTLFQWHVNSLPA